MYQIVLFNRISLLLKWNTRSSSCNDHLCFLSDQCFAQCSLTTVMLTVWFSDITSHKKLPQSGGWFWGAGFYLFSLLFSETVIVSLLIIAVLLYFETYKMKHNCRTNFMVQWPTSLNFSIELNCLNKTTTINAYVFLSIFRCLLVSYLKSCGSIFFPNIYGLK